MYRLIKVGNRDNDLKRKLYLFILLCLFSQNLIAKVIYIAWMEQEAFYPSSKKIVSLDLDTGEFINQKTYEGSYFSSLVINQKGSYLYVSDVFLNRIIKIDTNTFSVVHEWNNLPAYAEKIILNEANNRIYFTNTRSAGTGSDNVYQIDLLNNAVSQTNLPINGLDVQDMFWNKDKTFLIFKTSDFINSNYKYHSFSAMNMQLTAESSLNYLYKPVFDRNGLKYYGINTQANSIDSHSLVDGSLLWSSPLPLVFPLHFLIEYNNESLIVINNSIAYEINKSNGNLTIIDSPINIGETSLINVNEPILFCITGHCSLTEDLKIRKYNIETNSFENLLNQTYPAGAQDYAFGDKILESVKVSLLSNSWLLILTIVLIISTKKKILIASRSNTN